MGAQKGIITKITPTKCIIITKEGEFRSIPLPSGAVKVGQEIVVPSFKWPVLTKYALIAASLLIAILSVSIFQLTAAAAPVAYVSLDINPSLEIAVDKAAQVVGVTALNDDSQTLIADLDYRDKDIYTVMTKLLQRAVDLKYVTPERGNLIVSSVVEVDPQHVNLDTTRLQAAVVTPLRGKAIKANMVIYKAKNQDRTAAKKVKLSTGKYLFYEGEVENGNKITVDEVRKQSIASLVATKKAKLPRPKQEILIQSLNSDDKIEIVDHLNDDDTEQPVLTAPHSRDKANNNQGGYGKSELGKHSDSRENQTKDKQKPENMPRANSKNAAKENYQDNNPKAKDNNPQIRQWDKFKQDKQNQIDIKDKQDHKDKQDPKDPKDTKINEDKINSQYNKVKSLRQPDVKHE